MIRKRRIRKVPKTALQTMKINRRNQKRKIKKIKRKIKKTKRKVRKFKRKRKMKKRKQRVMVMRNLLMKAVVDSVMRRRMANKRSR